MTSRRNGFRNFAIAALLAIGVAATFATGGDGSSDGMAPHDGPTLLITAANAPDISAALIVAIGVGFDIGDIADANIPIPAGGMLFSLSALKGTENPYGKLVSPLAQELSNCANGGTVDITLTLENPNTVTVGDQIVAVFDSCDNDDGYVISGTIDLTVSDIQGDIVGGVFLLAFDMVLSDVVIEEGLETVTASGSFTLTFDDLDFPVVGLNLAGDEFQFGDAAEVLTLSNFDHDLRVDTGGAVEAIIALVSGTLESQNLGGTVDYETVVAVEATDDLDPHSGEILITGADDGTIRIVIVDSWNITLEVDANGDGVVDEYIYTNWSELNGNTAIINRSTAPLLAREVYNAVTGFGLVTTTGPTQFMPNAPFGQIDQMDISGEFGPLDIACVIAGNASVSGTKASTDVYTTGDQLTATFTSCARAQEVLNGDMDVTVASFGRSDGGTFYVTAAITETDLIRTIGGTCFTGSGTFDTSYDWMFTSAGIVYVSSMATDFSIIAGGRGQQLTNAQASAEITVSQQPIMISRESAGSLTSDAIDGTFSYQSLFPAVFNLDDDPATGPYSGELLVTATDGSTLNMVALDELNLRLDVDSDGDSFVDDELTTTWAKLGYGNMICP
jgi:hypothetical protein